VTTNLKLDPDACPPVRERQHLGIEAGVPGAHVPGEPFEVPTEDAEAIVASDLPVIVAGKGARRPSEGAGGATKGGTPPADDKGSQARSGEGS
jgi:hypothetical protein